MNQDKDPEELSPEEVEAISKMIGQEGKKPASGKEEPPKVTQPMKEGEEYPDKPSISRVQFMQLEEAAKAADLPIQDFERLYDIKVHVEVILGSTRMPLEEILKLQEGCVVQLDKLAGEPVDILINDQLIARAEVVVIEDAFGVKVLEIAGTEHKLKAAIERT
ncbi:flagellar motor switch protein FliN [Simkania negevensis]|uniref:Flagellar motor switch protein FliN n=1 Tax=Simkania negevensis TaxID=83561 RepID=A0ABS3APR0_9BACT|nr:flagellar motor switch protein FliN [Simkania negevensis]